MAYLMISTNNQFDEIEITNQSSRWPDSNKMQNLKF